MKPRVAVLMGGQSAEREVSLDSGRNVAEALETKGFEVDRIEITSEGLWIGRDKNMRGSGQVNLISGHFTVEGRKVEVVFIALHGELGEDGTAQGLFEILGVPYTGSGVLASALALNKLLSKRIFRQVGVPTVEFMALKKSDWGKDPKEREKEMIQKWGLPVVVKPVAQGSSVGVSIVREEDQLREALEKSFGYGDIILIERHLQAREIQCGVLGNKNPVPLPLVEIVSKKEFFDYEAKYTPSLAEEIVPAPVKETEAEKVKELSLRAYEALGCRGFARVDNFLTEEGQVFVSEVNTIPGLTAVSLFPKEAQAAGIEFPELVAKIVELALEPK